MGLLKDINSENIPITYDDDHNYDHLKPQMINKAIYLKLNE